ncbi:L-amino acid N-acyltransferase YncA [Micromonospora pattaloongensis]|uniref:L-amino acid N-acyltransferase YncA n=1 Tax=Micromonospora pattaloongensis TaxID=405436 RepID=A0A1H3KHV1_9ACTN|nr:GNAT family N-acetyltransferase [Micromonospora pattaloongensis]SDY51727.1 L-amino acid N-acyltransferase YncA [Micromonospora pattaloongensis]
MLIIRRERPEDAAAVADVHVRTWQTAYAGLMPPEVLGRLNPAAWAQRRRDVGTADPDHPFVTLVAAEADAVLGFATVGPYRNNQDPDDLDGAHGELLSMYVDPLRWGEGVGRALMAAVLAETSDRAWRQLRLWVLAGNTRGRRFFERAGLAPDGESCVYDLPLGPRQPPLPLTELRYARPLGPT